MGRLEDLLVVTARKKIPALAMVSIVYYTNFLSCRTLNILNMLIYIIRLIDRNVGFKSFSRSIPRYD